MSNTIPVKGDKNKLPHCKKCTGDDKKEDHDLKTYEHPYEMKKEEEAEDDE